MIAEHVVYIPGPYTSNGARWIEERASRFGSFHVLCPVAIGPPNRSLYVKAMEREVAKYPDGSVWVVAHDLGCHVVAHWAAVTQRYLAGAFLVAPPDIRTYESKGLTNGFWPHATKPFHFPSMVVMANNDKKCALQVGHSYASSWKSQFVNVGPMGNSLANGAVAQGNQCWKLFLRFVDASDEAFVRHGANWVYAWAR